ncbi:hypothetical protein CMO96_01660 [Candidatus Woesebacteria bacterium]|nr:hypothetical protein [Candidatus Woesebacteria bacterium]
MVEMVREGVYWVFPEQRVHKQGLLFVSYLSGEGDIHWTTWIDRVLEGGKEHNLYLDEQGKLVRFSALQEQRVVWFGW